MAKDTAPKKEEEQKQPEEVPAQETPTRPDPQTEFPALLKKLDNAPTQNQIEEWKVEFGDVYVSGFSEQEIFVWRPIRRKEYVELQSKANEEQWDQYKSEEETCRICVLWPKGNWSESKGGTASTLCEQIMQNSNFLPPQAAAYLVAKL